MIVASDFSGLKELLSTVFGVRGKLAVIADQKAFAVYGEQLKSILSSWQVRVYTVDGEAEKNFSTVERMLSGMNKDGFDRGDGVISFGGGVAGDVAGLVASLYMRGLKLCHIPTTILAMVDSCVGGKTAVDLNGIKNVVGTFYQPSAVYVNVSLSKTLTQKDVKSGWGEIIKYAMLCGDNGLIDRLFDENTVAKCLEIKKKFVEEDFFDEGARRYLNLGHTFGHAIESLSGFTLSHGECVVKGIYLALVASRKLLDLSAEDFDKGVKTIASKGHDLTCPFPLSELENPVAADKKAKGEKISFVAFDKGLKPVITEITVKELFEALQK